MPLTRRTALLPLAFALVLAAVCLARARDAAAYSPSSPVQFIQLSANGDRFLNYDGKKSFGFSNRDWPVSMIFYNDASVNRVEGFYRSHGYTRHGGYEFEYYALHTNYGKVRYDRDKGVKTDCVNYLDRHIRTYGSTQDRFYDPTYGYYIVATDHYDYGDGNDDSCARPTAQKYFGYTETVEHTLAQIAAGSYTVNEDRVDLKNAEPLRSEPDPTDHLHWWESDGKATLVLMP